MLKCKICGFQSVSIISHIEKSHDMQAWDYAREYGDIATEDVIAQVEGSPPPARIPEGVRTFCGVPIHPNKDVPLSDCLPEPDEGYHEPAFGEAAKVARFLTLGLKAGMSTFLYGPPGSGKDALIHAYSAKTRTPALKCQIIAGADIQAWLWTRALHAGETTWEEGSLLRIIRDGYETTEGRRIPALVLLSDFDRADSDQVETFRLILDTLGSGRIPLPQGGSVPVFPGTIFAATANTVGTGDSSGKFASANVIDSSIMNRFKVVREMPYMDWEDEQIPLLRNHEHIAKVAGFLPGVKMRESWSGLGAVVRVLRTMISEGRAYGEFTFRDLTNWLQFAELLSEGQEQVESIQKAIAESFSITLDRFDKATRHSLTMALQGHIPGLKIHGGGM